MYIAIDAVCFKIYNIYMRDIVAIYIFCVYTSLYIQKCLYLYLSIYLYIYINLSLYTCIAIPVDLLIDSLRSEGPGVGEQALPAPPAPAPVVNVPVDEALTVPVAWPRGWS